MTEIHLLELLDAVVVTIELEQDHLDRLDAAGGDADHGATMVLATRSARANVAALPAGAPLDAKLAAAGDGFASVGGSIGPLWAAMWYAASDVIADGVTGDGRLGLIVQRAVADASELGGAKEGDGTMIDALAPAARFRRDAGMSDAAFARGMADAAREGAEATAGRRAKVGRASRSTGVRETPDPGATSAAIILDIIARWIADLDATGADPTGEA